MPLNPLVNRYRDLNLFVPEGTFYQNDGNILPFRDTPYVLQFTTDTPNQQYGVFLNTLFQGVVNSDSSGNITVSVLLNLGENVLTLVNGFDQSLTQAWLTTRNYATWFAAFASQFEMIDDYIDTTQIDSQLANCFPQDLEAVWGNRINQFNDVGYDPDTYTELLEDLLVAKRLFGAKQKGLEIALGAFCQINPLDYVRKFEGKRWVLAFQYLNNNYWQTLTHQLVYTTTPVSGIEVLTLSEFSTAGSGSIEWDYPVTVSSGTHATILAFSPLFNQVAVGGLSGMNAAVVGSFLQLTGAAVTGNNSPVTYPFAFRILTYVSPTEVVVENALGQTPDANSGSISWTLYAPPEVVYTDPTLGPYSVIVDPARDGVYSIPGESLPARVVSEPGPFVVTSGSNSGATAAIYSGITTTVLGNQSVPTGTIVVNSTAGFPTSGTFYVYNSVNAVQAIAYTGLGTTAFYGCTGGTGTIDNGSSVYSGVAAPNGWVTVIGLTGMTQYDIGQYLQLSGAAHSSNNSPGTYPYGFLIVGYVSPTTVLIYNPSAFFPDANNGSILWALLPAIKLNVDNKGVITIPVNSPVSYNATAMAAYLNSAFAADVQYGSAYNSIVTVTGTDVRFRITSVQEGSSGTITIYASSLAQTLFGLTGSQLPRLTSGWEDTIVTINVVNESVPNVPVTKNFTTYQATMPEGWIILGDSAWAIEPAVPQNFVKEFGTLFVTSGGTDVTLQAQAVSETADYLGFGFTIGVWALTPDTGVSLFLGWSFDGGTTWTEGPSQPMTQADDIAQSPTFYSQYFIYDPYATSLTIRARFSGGYSGETTTVVGTQTLPSTPITVADTGTFGSSGNFYVYNSIDELETVGYTGTTSTTFTGASGGTGTIENGATVYSEFPTGFQVYVSWTQLTCSQITAAFLGNNTIPRNRNRSYFGHLLFAWCPDLLNQQEMVDSGLGNTILPTIVGGSISLPTANVTVSSTIGFAASGGTFDVLNTLGVVQTVSYASTDPTQTIFQGCTGGSGTVANGTTVYATTAIPYTPNGQLDLIGACNTQMDRFNITEFNPSTLLPLNIAGVIYEADWANSTLTNLSIQPRTPDRFTHVIPTIVGPITETVFFAFSSPNYNATLQNISDENQANSILFQDGIPVTQNNWSFTGSSQITILFAAYDSASVYTLQYNPLLEAETPVIDLGVGYTNYVWFADFYEYVRYAATPTQIPIVGAQLFVNFSTFIATLDLPAITDQALTQITRYDGITAEILPQDSWAFLSTTTISIDGSQITPSALYTINYYQQGMAKPSIITPSLMIRSATTSSGVSTATYQPIAQNAPVRTTGGLRYHQLLITLEGAQYVTDVRLSSMILKGLDIFGAGAVVPGLSP
jgi:hypothetical protein